jgi:hypothetical protein
MKFYCIPPNKHLELMDEGDSYFCLAHHYKNDSNYRQFFLNLKSNKPSCWITLDNGAAEHSTVTEEDLLQIVNELKPTEVIPPDVLFDKEQTLKNFYSFCRKMYMMNFLRHTFIFACPQGSTKELWLDCYYNMLGHPFVKCMGLSKIAVPKCWNNAEGDTLIAKSRNECIEDLIKKHYLCKPVHLLGMGEHNEFDYYSQNKIQNIRSSDSCYSVLAAINDIDFEKGDTTRISTTNQYFEVELNEHQINLAKRNIRYLKAKYKNI